MNRTNHLKILLLILCGILCDGVKAQTDVDYIEGEVNLGLTHPLSKYDGRSGLLDFTIGGELRYNFRSSPFDCGIGVNYVSFGWDDEMTNTEHNASTNIYLIGDYNFRQGNRVNPYIGAGIGIAIRDNECGRGPMFMPRVGVELWRHLRFSLSMQLNRAHYNGFALTIGVVFGGGKV